MPMRVGNIAFDCDDVLNVGGFWSETLGRPLDPGSGPAFASIGGDDADRTEPAWYFEKLLEPAAAQNHVHLDLVDREPPALDRLVNLGASIVGEYQIAGGRSRRIVVWIVMQDPEGNKFCVAANA